MLHGTQATLATQPAVPGYADIQKMVDQLIHSALHRITQDSLHIFQYIPQTRQLRNRHFTADLLAISGKIQTIDERSCVHEARMIYFSPHSVKNPKEYR